MNRLIRLLLAALLLACSGVHAQNSTGSSGSTSTTSARCTGEWPDYIKDLCWSCVLPLSLGSFLVANYNSQEDNGDNPGLTPCNCGTRPVIGLPIGFWEPARRIEVVRKPFCFPSLGGLDLGDKWKAPEHGRRASTSKGHADKSFYQSHYYADPVLTTLGVLSDQQCFEQGGFDIAYITEVDPLWDSDSMSMIINPDAVLFTNYYVQAVCGFDCAMSTHGFGFEAMFWCAGCQGGVYPLNGNVGTHNGLVRTASLIAQRMLMKLHRETVAWGYHKPKGLCGPYVNMLYDKRAYKTQLIWPSTQNRVSRRCCSPLGRDTQIQGSGKEMPARGEDATFEIYRKRNCCAGWQWN